MPRTRWFALVLIVALWAPVASADILVLKDGTAVQTEGEWEVKGRLVVFTSAAGTLSSMRLTEIDLDASRQATQEALRAAMAPPAESSPEERPKAVLVLKDGDVPKAVPPAADGEANEKAVEGTASGTVEVIEWNVDLPSDRDGAVVSGRLRNNGSTIAVGIQLEVLAYDSDGTLLGKMAADVVRRPVAPGRVVDFEALFRGIYNITAAKFVVQSDTFDEQQLEPAS
ncbi:MAG: FxLYD domain-containing protein [Acidobacteriota bacterium]